MAVARVTLRRNWLRATASDPTNGHAAIQLAGHAVAEGAPPGTVTDVVIDGNLIEGGMRAGIWVGPFSRRITVLGNVIAGVSGDAIGVGPEAADIVVGRRGQADAANLAQSSGGYGIYVDTHGAAGRLEIVGNRFEAINGRGAAYIDAIHLSAGVPFVEAVIFGNRLELPADRRVERFIESHVTVTLEENNTSNVELPNYFRPVRQDAVAVTVVENTQTAEESKNAP